MDRGSWEAGMVATRQTGLEGGGDVLALGFGTTVAMWAAAYLARLPGLELPGPGLGVSLVAIALAGGFVAGRLGPRGVCGGAWSGLLTAALNLLVLGSLLSGDEPGVLRPSAPVWVPGFLLAGALLGSAGAWLGRRGRVGPPGERSWTAAFAGVTAVATLILVVVGGVVTSNHAGLAVVDWPNSFGYNMFLYPLSRMTGGVFLEHAHRLLGSLVGLTTLTLAIHLTLVEKRGLVRFLAWLAVVLVAIQGVLGGLRVTGHLTTSTAPAAMAPSETLAMIHGVLGQVVLGILVVLAVLTSALWQSGRGTVVHPGAAMERGLALALLGVLLLQLVLGALVRHLGQGLMVHITVAVAVTGLAIAAGARLWALIDRGSVLCRLGKGLLHAVAFQVVLGILALIAVGGLEADAPRQGWRALVTTLHQANGAVLLVMAVLLTLLSSRLLREPEAVGP
jgi:cytochrome c oxidase assembly protein subunit 15